MTQLKLKTLPSEAQEAIALLKTLNLDVVPSQPPANDDDYGYGAVIPTFHQSLDEFTERCVKFNISASWYGRKFDYEGNCFQILGIDPKATVGWPLVCGSDDGRFILNFHKHVVARLLND